MPLRPSLFVLSSLPLLACAAPAPRGSAAIAPQIAPVASVGVAPAPGSGLAGASRPEAACVISTTNVATGEVLPLRKGGKIFASVPPESRRVELRLSPGKTGGVITLEHDTFSLTGEVRLEDLHLRPRTPYVKDGWLELVDVPGAKSEVSPRAEIFGEVDVPDLVQGSSRRLRFSLPCEELALEDASAGDAPVAQQGLAAGARATLRAQPGGPPVADLLAPPAPSPRVTLDILERRDALVRVRARPESSATAAIGWIASSALEPSPAGPADPHTARRRALEEAASFGMIGLHGAPPALPQRILDCPNTLPIRVHGGPDGAPIVVGHLAAHAPVPLRDGKDDGVEAVLALTPMPGDRQDQAPPFARVQDLAACTAR